MRQWDVYLFPFEKEKPHPVVIVSNDERCERMDQINGLICVSLRGGKDARKHEVILDQADGMDWKTAVRCDLLYLLDKREFLEKRGEVSRERRRQIGHKIIECLRLLQG